MRKVLTDRDWSKMQLMPASEVEEITQNIGVIVSTPLGTAPMCRDVGLNNQAFYKPDIPAKALLIRDCFDAVADQEERAELISADFKRTGEGKWEATLEVEI